MSEYTPKEVFEHLGITPRTRRLKIKPTKADDIDAALELVCELAFQNTCDRYENPTRYRAEMAAINLVKETFTKSGELR